MDCDNDDTQGSNLQLAGEGRSKSSSVLIPYSFPRFDFDGSLYGYLRFDSLVEPESFFGIQGEEDNQWVEDYSRGNNVIEFSSRSTDSCSISRRNNVWSEATSSESVEMLLKSVGQEQIVHAASVMNNSIAPDDLGRLAKQMETIRDKDTRSSGCMRISDYILPPDELLSNIPVLKDNVEGNMLHVQEPSLSQISLSLAHENSDHLGPDVSEQRFVAPASGINFLMESECGSKSGKEAQCPVGESLNCSTDSSSPFQEVESSIGILDSFESAKDARNHTLEGGYAIREGINYDMEDQRITAAVKTDTHVLEHLTVGDALHTVRLSTCHASNIDKGNSDESMPNLCIELDKYTTIGETEFQLPKGSGKGASCLAPIHPKAGKANSLFTTAMVIDTNRNGDPVAIARELHDSEMIPNDGSEPKWDSDIQLLCEHVDQKLGNLAESIQKDYNGRTGSVPEKSTVKRKADEYTVDKIDNMNNIAMGKSSEELIRVTDGTTSVNDLTDASTMNVEELRSLSGSGSISLIKENKSNFSVDVLTASSTTATAGTEGKVKGSIILDESVIPDKNMADHVQPKIMNMTESEINVLPTKKINRFVDAKKEDSGAEPLAADVSGPDDKEETASKMLMDVSLSTVYATDQVETELGRVNEAEFLNSTSFGPQLCESNEKSPPEVKDIDPRADLSNFPERLGSHPDHQEKSPNNIGSGDVSCAESLDNAVMVIESRRVSSLGAADDVEVASGSPTKITSGDPCQHEGCKQQETRGSEDVNGFPVTELSISECLKEKNAPEDENSSTFKVHSLPKVVEREKGSNWTPLFIAEAHKPLKAPEVSGTPDGKKIDANLPLETFVSKSLATTPSVEMTQAKLPQQNPDASPKLSDGESAGRSAKSGSCCRGRQASGKGTAKDNSLKVKNQKETIPSKSSLKGEKVPSVLTSPSGSALTALNTTCSPPTPASQQPFTNLQQVQLRAQIFVYGYLIQGTAPEESCMVSAFGRSDGGRNMWESVWQAAVERVCCKHSQSSAETLVSSAGVKVSDVADKQGSQPRKLRPSPVNQGGSKGAPKILNPVTSLSSPSCGISTSRERSLSIGMQRGTVTEYQPSISPVHPYQTPPVQSFIGHIAWPSPPPSPPSQRALQMPALNTSVQSSTVPISEPVKLSPAKDPPLLSSSSVMSTLTSHKRGDTSLVSAGVSSSLPEQTPGISSSRLPSADQKPRRSKKSQDSYDISQSPLISRGQTKYVSASPVATPFSLIAVTALDSHAATSATVGSPVSSFPQARAGNLDIGKASTCSEEILRRVSEAKLHAEEADSLAAAALGHSQSVWIELSARKEFGTSSEAEAKISSAASAVVAAAAVAKAAAAAAKVASNAALQGKLMAEEARLPSKNESQSQCGVLSSDMHGKQKRDDDCSQSSSIVTVAREVATRRIEAATAAAKQVENLDAIVKAAELAAEAASQAGKVVVLGDPLPLKELINASPEGSWKSPQASSDLDVPLSCKKRELINVSSEEAEGGSSDVRIKDAPNDRETPSYDMLSDSLDEYVIADGISLSIASLKNDQDVLKKPKNSDIDESSRAVLLHKADFGTGTAQECEELDLVQEDSIHKGSLVEVYKHGDGLKPAWFFASVLALEDRNTFVSYAGSKKLEEWVALDGQNDEAPIIRAAPSSTFHQPGTRKRHCTVMEDYSWIVGDRVDVQFHDCWWEGVVTDINEEDVTTLTVHFPDRGETSAVSSWQLRPSRVWNDGKWVEWSRPKGHDHFYEGGMPHEKRQKLGSSFVVSNGKDKPPKGFVNHMEPKALVVGKSSKAYLKPDAQRTLETRLQEEGSKVVFAVPKAGKKRKFMEVSKHYCSDRQISADSNNNNEANDILKFGKPHHHATVPCGWKSFYEGKQMAPEEGPPPLSCYFPGQLEKLSCSSAKYEWCIRGKLGGPSGVKSSKIKEDDGNDQTGGKKVDPQAVEPRRSGRRIKPSYRLLEGLETL